MGVSRSEPFQVKWEDVKVPIKRCEFIKTRVRFINMTNEDLNETISNLVLGSLAAPDREFIVKNLNISLDEAINGTDAVKTEFLWDLMKLIMFKYREYKLLFYDAVRNANIEKALSAQERIFFHYEALRNLKRRLLGGKDLLYIDMPDYRTSD